MKIYSEEIVKAYTKWMDAVISVPSEQWHEDYKKKLASEKRAMKKFISLCRINDLNYLQVCKDLQPTKI